MSVSRSPQVSRISRRPGSSSIVSACRDGPRWRRRRRACPTRSRRVRVAQACDGDAVSSGQASGGAGGSAAAPQSPHTSALRASGRAPGTRRNRRTIGPYHACWARRKAMSCSCSAVARAARSRVGRAVNSRSISCELLFEPCQVELELVLARTELRGGARGRSGELVLEREVLLVPRPRPIGVAGGAQLGDPLGSGALIAGEFAQARAADLGLLVDVLAPRDELAFGVVDELVEAGRDPPPTGSCSSDSASGRPKPAARPARRPSRRARRVTARRSAGSTSVTQRLRRRHEVGADRHDRRVVTTR